MVKCEICNREMLTAKGCIKVPVIHKKVVFDPIPCGHPDDLLGLGANERCHDCGAKKGGYHHPGCDAERCPVCKRQALGCGCNDDN